MITFFTCLCISRYFFFQNSFKGAELVPPFAASIMANFEHLLWKGVGNILKRSFTEGYGDSE